MKLLDAEQLQCTFSALCPEMSKGILLCDLVAAMEGVPVIGVFRPPKSDGTKVAAVRRACERLARHRLMSKRFLFNHDDVAAGVPGVILGLLEARGFFTTGTRRATSEQYWDARDAVHARDWHGSPRAAAASASAPPVPHRVLERFGHLENGEAITTEDEFEDPEEEPATGGGTTPTKKRLTTTRTNPPTRPRRRLDRNDPCASARASWPSPRRSAPRRRSRRRPRRLCRGGRRNSPRTWIGREPEGCTPPYRSNPRGSARCPGTTRGRCRASQAQGERPGGGEEPRGGVGGCRGGVSRGALQQRAARAAAADAPQVGCRKAAATKPRILAGLGTNKSTLTNERGVRAGDGGAGVRRG